MRLGKMILTGSILVTVSTIASAQTTPPTQKTPMPPDTQKGLVTVVNRLNGTIAIREEQNDKNKDTDKDKDTDKNKNGAVAEGATTQFKIDHKLSETVHAGDKVKFSVSDGGDPKGGDPKTNTEKTITKIETE